MNSSSFSDLPGFPGGTNKLTVPDKMGTFNLTFITKLLLCVGKDPVICKEVPGHIGVRLTTALRREAYYIVEQGYATPEAVDTVLRSVARLLPVIGALVMTDFSGVDVLRDVHRNIQPHLDHRPEPSPLLDELIEGGKLGIKSGEGFYRWSPEQAQEFFEARGRELIRWMQQPPLPPPPPPR